MKTLLFLIALFSASPNLFADSLDSSSAPAKIKPAAPPKARPFGLHDVRLLDGPFKAGQDIAVKYLLSLEPDRFLANFRKEAGLQPKAQPYPGWERQGISGHSCGHYLSACAIAYAVTDDPRFLERVQYIVSELADCQTANGTGYVAAIPNGKKVYADLAAGNIRSSGFDLNGCWVPNYTMHKLFAGLRDAWRLCGNAKALEVAKGLADWFDRTLANLTEAEMQKILVTEHGGINETLADLYADTSDERYLQLSRRFHHRAILDPLSRGEDILPGKHANTQIPKLIGLATRYELTGDTADRAAADFFWNRVVYHHSYVTGGHCNHEYFGPPDQLNDRLSAATTETCNVYNMLKLTRHVFGWNPDAAVADFYERALLNHIRATQHPDGRVIYNLSLLPGHHKDYQRLYDGFTCCMGTGMENHVKYGEAIYFHDDESLWVNLFIASELRWKQRGIALRQETKFPEPATPTSIFTFTCDTAQEFTLSLRHPHWAKSGIQIRVNGQPCAADTKPSSFAEIRRLWKTGDRVELTLPMSLRTESMPDNPKRIALFHGPTLLAANLGPVNDPDAGKAMFVPALVTDSPSVLTLINPVPNQSLTFAMTGLGRPRDVELVPFFRLHDRRYTVYFDVLTPSEWKTRETDIRAEQEREQRLSERTVDVLRVGEMQPERDHNVRGERTGAGEFNGRKWRHAVNGGWFSFEVKVPSDRPAELICTYWGSDAGGRIFDVLVEGERLATQALRNNKPNQFFDVTYPVPEKLVRGKQKVTVRLQAHPGGTAGGLFGARIVKAEPKSAHADLEPISNAPPEETPTQRITIEAAKAGSAMSPHIYGQFIEHLGRCIYGGIWAEMLEDRKFFFPITPEYRPYRRLTDQPFPVISASPWEITGAADSVAMSTNRPFVGKHTPIIRSGTGIGQRDLGVTEGKTYAGYVWLKAAEATPGAIELALDCDDAGNERSAVKLSGVGSDQYRRFPFALVARKTTDRARFELRVLEGAAFVGTVSLMPGDNIEGMRADTLALLRELNAPIYRWPGGNFVSGYDWRDGIGDRDRRPPRTNPAWTGVEHNDFGMHEFIRFCRLVQAEPWITINTGFGDAYSAAAQLEYCNGAAGTLWGKGRVENGAPEPFRVQYWGIGNEMWGSWQLGYMKLDHYVLKQNWVVDKMREVDPGIRCIASGNMGPWSTGLLKHCSDHMDFIAEHFYCQEKTNLAAHVRLIADNIRRKAEFHRKARQDLPELQGKDIRVAMTEWNYWYGPHVFGELGTRYFLKDALGVAAGLHEYARQSDIISSAFYAQTVNVIGCVKTSRRNAVFETTGLVLKLYRQHFGQWPVATEVSGEIDAQAAWSADRKTLTVGVVNPSLSEAVIRLDVRGTTLKGVGRRWQIAGADPKAFNDPDQPLRVFIEEQPVTGPCDTVRVEPCSVTLFALDAQ